MVHAAVAEARPGEVLVLTMPEPRPIALVGELLATQAKGRGSRRCSWMPPYAISRSCASSGCRSGRATCACRARRSASRARSASRSRSAARTIRQGDVVVLDADGAVVVEQERVDEVLAAARDRAEREREKRAKLQAGELSYDLDGLRAARGDMSEPLHDLARIGHAELLTPKPDESLRFFVDVLGMEEEARDGQSVYLRGWGDYLRYSLKLTESPQAGLGHVALRAWSPEALERRVAAIEATGLGQGWIDGDVGHGPAYRFTDPDGHVFELYYEAERYDAARAPEAVVEEPAAALRRSRRRREAARPRQRARCGRAREPRVRPGRPRLPAVRADRARRRHRDGRLAEPLDRRPRADLRRGRVRRQGRLHHLAFWVDTREECLRAADLFVDNDVYIEAAPSKHGVAQGFFLYGFEPGGNRIEVTTGGYFVYDPDFEPISWTAAGARSRAVLGRADDRELPHLRHAGRRGRWP